jgi:uncharacterized protein (TIGR00369 family)
LTAHLYNDEKKTVEMMLEDPRFKKVKNLALHQFFGISDWYSKDGQARLSIKVNASTANPNGMLHGGVIYALCDVSAYIALLGILPPNMDAVTHDIHVSVLRPVHASQKVTFNAKVIKPGKRICFIESVAMVEDRVIATAGITKSLVDLK